MKRVTYTDRSLHLGTRDVRTRCNGCISSFVPSRLNKTCGLHWSAPKVEFASRYNFFACTTSITPNEPGSIFLNRHTCDPWFFDVLTETARLTPCRAWTLGHAKCEYLLLFRRPDGAARPEGMSLDVSVRRNFT